MSWHWRMIVLVWPWEGRGRWGAKCVYRIVDTCVFPLCVIVFVCMSQHLKLNGSEGRWKGKVFKGHMYLSTWVLLHYYSYQYSTVIPDLAHQTTKNPALSLRKKPLFSSSWSYTALMKWSIVCVFSPLRSLKGSLGSRGRNWFLLIAPGDSGRNFHNRNCDPVNHR